MIPQICPTPFRHFEIFSSGDVFPCCPVYCRQYSLGNLLKQNMDEIWRGERARIFRLRIENGDYSGCDLSTCVPPARMSLPDIKKCYFHNGEIRFPENIIISYDRECNLSCRICPCKHSNSQEDIERYLLIENNYLPWLKDCKILRLSGCGDPFASRYSRGLIRRVIDRWPHIKFDFITNGLCLTPQLYKELDLAGRIVNMAISIHAATAETYRKVTRHGNFARLLSNLEFLHELKKNGRIPSLVFNFVVYDENYREMPEFRRLAFEHGAMPLFTKYQKRGNEELASEYELHAVFNKEHPEHQNFISVLTQPELRDERNIFDGGLRQLLAEANAKDTTPWNALSPCEFVEKQSNLPSSTQQSASNAICSKKSSNLFCFCLLLSIDHGHCDEDNILRASLLLTSLSVFAQEEFDIYIVTPQSSYLKVKNVLPVFHNLHYHFVTDEEILPDINSFNITTWYKQQYLKLAISKVIDYEFYMLLDADFVCINDFSSSNFIKGEKSYLKYHRLAESQACWYAASAAILGVDPPCPEDETMGVTPNVMNSKIASSLLAFIEQKYEKRAADVLLSNPASRWSEYSIYYLYSLLSNTFSEKHIEFHNYESHKFSSTKGIHLLTPKGCFYKIDTEYLKNENKEFICIGSLVKIPMKDVYEKFEILIYEKIINSEQPHTALDILKNVKKSLGLLDFKDSALQELRIFPIYPYFFNPDFKPLVEMLAQQKGMADACLHILKHFAPGDDSQTEKVLASASQQILLQPQLAAPFSAIGNWDVECAFRELLALLWPYKKERAVMVRVGGDGEQDGFVMADPAHDGLVICIDATSESSWLWRRRMEQRRFKLCDLQPVLGDDGNETIAAELAKAIYREGNFSHSILYLNLNGSEWDLLAALPRETLLRFDQLICRFHGATEKAKVGDYTRILDKLRMSHLPIHIHYGNSAPILAFSDFIVADIIEVVFHKKGSWKFTHTCQSFPGPLDEPCNRRFPDLFIGEFPAICGPLDAPEKVCPQSVLNAFTHNGAIQVSVPANAEYSGKYLGNPDENDITAFVKSLSAVIQGNAKYRLLVLGDLGYRLSEISGRLPGMDVAAPDAGNNHGEGLLARIKDMSARGKLYDVIVMPDDIARSGLHEFWHEGAADMDLEIMRQLKKLLKSNGTLLLSVPVGEDRLIWRTTRIYGPLRLPLLFKSWNRLCSFPGKQQDKSLLKTVFALTPNRLSYHVPAGARPQDIATIARISGCGAFDHDFYASAYPDTLNFNGDAVSHYVLHGCHEGRNPAPWFNTEKYLCQNPALREARLNPFLHYLCHNFISGGKMYGNA